MREGKRKPKKKHWKLWLFVKIQLVLMLLVIGGVAYFFVGGYANTLHYLRDEAAYLVRNSKDADFKSIQTSVVYDCGGEVLSVMKGEKDIYYLSYNEIPIYAKEAIISIEDKKFKKHKGVDYRAIIRAGWAMIRDGKVTQGGSTITQQLARTVFLTQDKTWERKIEEIYISLNLEKRYSKEQILEYYLNSIYFANGYYGIEAASRGYFDKESSQLSLSQIAFLCAIPNSPTLYDPLTNLNHTIDRRNLILRNMYDDGIISLVEYQSAINEIIMINPPEITKHNYEETYTYYCATKALMQMEGFNFRFEFGSEEDKEKYDREYRELYNECNAKLYTGGYRIYTSLDPGIQACLQEAIDNGLEEFDEVSDEGVYTLQGAGVCIDNESGFVKAIVGGRSQDYEGYTLNRGYQSYRQPGSAIKPLIVYTPALERGYTADTLVNDKKIEDGPTNADGTYSGNITLRRAVELSRNTVAYNLLGDITPQVGLSYLSSMGFARLSEDDNIQAIALGGFTNGVSPVEMAEGFATLENNGFFREATCVVQITDYSGNVLYEPNRIRTVVYNEDAAWQMTDILRGVLTNGTGKGLEIPDMPCAGKTGTTNDNKDGWFVGYTPYYTCSIWVGYDKPKELKGLMGSTYPGHIWNDFMTTLHQGLPPKEFSQQIIGMGEEDVVYDNTPITIERIENEVEEEIVPENIQIPLTPQEQEQELPAENDASNQLQDQDIIQEY